MRGPEWGFGLAESRSSDPAVFRGDLVGLARQMWLIYLEPGEEVAEDKRKETKKKKSALGCCCFTFARLKARRLSCSGASRTETARDWSDDLGKALLSPDGLIYSARWGHDGPARSCTSRAFLQAGPRRRAGRLFRQGAFSGHAAN